MKKTEFLERLSQELEKRNVADPADIVEEYEQHFAMKMDDGYAEEEIAARLCSPASLAAQFSEGETAEGRRGGSKTLTAIGLGIADVFAGLLFLLLAGFGLVLAAAAVACGTLTVCLLGNLSVGGLIPTMPYWCGAVLALALFAACFVLSYVVCALSAGSFQFWHVWGWFVK